MKVEECLDRLREIMLNKISKEKYDLTTFSVKCDISYSELYNLLNRKNADIKLSTLLKICENLNISYSEILGTK